MDYGLQIAPIAVEAHHIFATPATGRLKGTSGAVAHYKGSSPYLPVDNGQPMGSGCCPVLLPLFTYFSVWIIMRGMWIHSQRRLIFLVWNLAGAHYYAVRASIYLDSLPINACLNVLIIGTHAISFVFGMLGPLF